MAVQDFAARIDASLDLVPEGAGRDYPRNFAAALRARAPEKALPNTLRVISSGRDAAAADH